MTDLTDWIERRSPAVPAPMRAALADALEVEPGTGSGDPLPDRLAVAGLDALERVLAGPGDRSAAATLLAADALLTFACEAAAESGPGELDRVLGELDPARFAVLLEAGPR